MTNKSLIEELGELAARWEAVGAQLCPLRTELGRAQGATELRALISKHSASSEAGGPDYRAMYDTERVKFQNETRRTSEYAELLRELVAIADGDFGESRSKIPALASRARVLMEQPINKPATETKAEPTMDMQTARGIAAQCWCEIANELRAMLAAAPQLKKE
jgi:hypothetical protein